MKFVLNLKCAVRVTGHPAREMEPLAKEMQYSDSKIEHPAREMKHPDGVIEYPVRVIKYTAGVLLFPDGVT